MPSYGRKRCLLDGKFQDKDALSQDSGSQEHRRGRELLWSKKADSAQNNQVARVLLSQTRAASDGLLRCCLQTT